MVEVAGVKKSVVSFPSPNQQLCYLSQCLTRSSTNPCEAITGDNMLLDKMWEEVITTHYSYLQRNPATIILGRYGVQIQRTDPSQNML